MQEFVQIPARVSCYITANSRQYQNNNILFNSLSLQSGWGPWRRVKIKWIVWIKINKKQNVRQCVAGVDTILVCSGDVITMGARQTQNISWFTRHGAGAGRAGERQVCGAVQGDIALDQIRRSHASSHPDNRHTLASQCHQVLIPVCSWCNCMLILMYCSQVSVLSVTGGREGGVSHRKCYWSWSSLSQYITVV